MMGAIILAWLGRAPERGTGTGSLGAFAASLGIDLADVFRYVFVCAAVCLALAFVSITAMEERPLRGHRDDVDAGLHDLRRSRPGHAGGVGRLERLRSPRKSMGPGAFKHAGPGVSPIANDGWIYDQLMSRPRNAWPSRCGLATMVRLSAAQITGLRPRSLTCAVILHCGRIISICPVVSFSSPRCEPRGDFIRPAASRVGPLLAGPVRAQCRRRIGASRMRRRRRVTASRISAHVQVGEAPRTPVASVMSRPSTLSRTRARRVRRRLLGGNALLRWREAP